MKTYEVVSFIQHGDYWHFDTPPPAIFIISDRLMVMPAVEVTRIDLWMLLYLAVRNTYRLWKWKLESRLYRVGALDPKPGMVLSWRHDFRWRFWRTRRNHGW